ncbi:MAG TPA: hypothetical protein VE077_17650 [Candidatus Methylomirabilis sp.]|nr:hypothetical protein [Candidatus Methylomirabilis sp.]
MANKLKCNSCGGTYPDTTQPSNVAYFHVCPDELIDTHAVCDENGNMVKPATFKPTPNPRNENLKPNLDKPGENAMISEGSGVTPV